MSVGVILGVELGEVMGDVWCRCVLFGVCLAGERERWHTMFVDWVVSLKFF